MKKELVAPSKTQKGSVTLVTDQNGVLLAACGCGAQDKKNEYDFAELLRRENLKRELANKPVIIMGPQSCDCGGTLQKIFVPVDSKCNRETGHRTHHAKPRLRKNKRTTIRGMMTAI